jgi:hypothetical protein
MNTMPPKYQEARRVCEHGEPAALDGLVRSLADPLYLAQLDDREVYEQVVTPPNLTALLECLFQRRDLSGGADRLLALAQTEPYRADEDPAAVRRAALVRAAGFAATATPGVIAFLDDAVTGYGGEFQEPAVRSLARLGTPEAVRVLWTRVFDPRSSVVEAEVREIYWPTYTALLGEHRDKLPVLDLMLQGLYPTSVRNMVLRCLVEDVVRTAPDPAYHYTMATLNAATPGAVALATRLATWLIRNGEGLGGPRDVEGVARRITELLDTGASVPSATDPEAVRAWAIRTYETAAQRTADPQRRAEIAAAVPELRR